MMDLFWMLSVAAIATAAIAIAVVPARWLGRTILLWLVLPVPVYFVVIFWEASVSPAATHVLSNALLGFSLISAFLLIPWLIVSGVGFLFGFLIRGMSGRTR